MKKKERLEVGKIVTTHGVRGEVKIEPWSDDAALFLDVETLFFEDGTEALIEDGRLHKNHPIVKFKGIETLDEAESLRGQVLFIRRSDIPTPSGHVLVQDMIGLPVFDERLGGKQIGTLKDVRRAASPYDYYIVTDGSREFMIPAIRPFLQEVSLEDRRITLRTIEGMGEDAN